MTTRETNGHIDKRVWFAVLLLALLILTTACSAQVAGMNSPVFHDYGEIEWVPFDREIEQWFIAGTGYSAAIQNDPSTSSDEYIARLAELPVDATSGDLQEIRLGMRLANGGEGAWNSGATLVMTKMVLPTNSDTPRRGGPVTLFEIDQLPRSGDMLVISNLPAFAAGDVVTLNLIPGDGDALEVAVTPHRSPYAGWRATTNGEALAGALVYETRYQRDVAVGEIVGSGLDRMTNGGSGFILLWAVVSGGLLTGIVVLSRRGRTDGR